MTVRHRSADPSYPSKTVRLGIAARLSARLDVE
jgi:hypothetical protein